MNRTYDKVGQTPCAQFDCECVCAIVMEYKTEMLKNQHKILSDTTNDLIILFTGNKTADFSPNHSL